MLPYVSHRYCRCLIFQTDGTSFIRGDRVAPLRQAVISVRRFAHTAPTIRSLCFQCSIILSFPFSFPLLLLLLFFFVSRAEFSQELLIFLLLVFNTVDALFADDQALGWPQNLLLDNEVCLPALHTLFIILKFTRARHHPLDMLKVFLQVLDDIFFLQLFTIFKIFQSLLFNLDFLFSFV